MEMLSSKGKTLIKSDLIAHFYQPQQIGQLGHFFHYAFSFCTASHRQINRQALKTFFCMIQAWTSNGKTAEGGLWEVWGRRKGSSIRDLPQPVFPGTRL